MRSKSNSQYSVDAAVILLNKQVRLQQPGDHYVGKPSSQLGQLSLSSFRSRMSSRPVYRMCAQVAPSGKGLRGKGQPGRMLAKTLAPSVSGCLYPLG